MYTYCRFRFGDLNILESFEVDCADYSLSRDLESEAQGTSELPTGSKIRAHGDLTDETESASSVETGVVPESATLGRELSIPDSKLRMILSGRRRVNHLVELKTRRKGSDFPQYIWSQVHYLTWLLTQLLFVLNWTLLFVVITQS